MFICIIPCWLLVCNPRWLQIIFAVAGRGAICFWVSAILQLNTICCKLSFWWPQSWQISSESYQRFWGFGRVSYVALIMKLSLAWDPPQISPCHDPISGGLPGYPSPLLALAYGFDLVALLFLPHNFGNDNFFPFCFWGFEPHLRCCSPTKACSALLHNVDNLLVFQASYGLVYCLWCFLFTFQSALRRWCFAPPDPVSLLCQIPASPSPVCSPIWWNSLEVSGCFFWKGIHLTDIVKGPATSGCS